MMNEKEFYFLKRKQLKIRMIALANYMNCSQSLISRYENGQRSLSEIKLQKYREFIDNYKT
ncbi:helix-turn-helix domain-containing protein [Priestia flexa]|uniref:helix-turn-helix domain-containing protein n=1 Tax=Bacillaceae TaxID=186817 RepID=UPI000B2101F1|nr:MULTISPECIES: helix-turn-helix transcriptional regulator [Bacillaceae]